MPELANDLGLSKKIANVKASGIRIFDNKVSTIPGIIKLTLGEPDMNTPEHVKQAAIKSIADNDSHYAPQKVKNKQVIHHRSLVSAMASMSSGSRDCHQ